MIERACQSPGDLALMLALAHRCPAENPHVIDLPYRLSSWALDESGNTRLWFDGTSKLRAWAVLQTPFWAIDYVLDPPGDQALHGQVLDWAVQRATQLRGDPVYARPAWFANALDFQTARMAGLASRGFADQMHAPEDPWSKVWMARPGQAAFEAGPLPPGYRLREPGGQAEAAACVDLHRAVFQSKSMTVAWRERLMRQPAYRPDLDLVIEAPDGSLAAYCLGWFDPAGYAGRPGGQIEPLGVRPDLRGQGLARALLAECFRRLHSLGAEQIYVETDNYRDAAFALYESAGFRVLHQLHVFRKDFDSDGA